MDTVRIRSEEDVPMDPRIMLSTFRVEHGHRDGSWGVMVEERSPHDSADLDPERRWGRRRIFKCSSCDEAMSIESDTPDPTRPDR
jgi:hypothetical protein